MTAVLFDRRQVVRRQVKLFRDASRRLRELKRNSRGRLFNPSLSQLHANQMMDIRNRLEIMGHKQIGRLLTQWHLHLMTAREAEDSAQALQQSLLARETSENIRRAIQEIR